MVAAALAAAAALAGGVLSSTVTQLADRVGLAAGAPAGVQDATQQRRAPIPPALHQQPAPSGVGVELPAPPADSLAAPVNALTSGFAASDQSFSLWAPAPGVPTPAWPGTPPFVPGLPDNRGALPGLPQVPGLPQLPELPQLSFPDWPGTPPFVPDPNFPGTPPVFPQLPQLPGNPPIIPELPTLPGVPDPNWPGTPPFVPDPNWPGTRPALPQLPPLPVLPFDGEGDPVGEGEDG